MAKEEELATFLGFIGGLKEYELQKAREEYQKLFDEDIRKLLKELEEDCCKDLEVEPRGISPIITIMEKMEAKNG